jgi:hypothetical protein
LGQRASLAFSGKKILPNIRFLKAFCVLVRIKYIGNFDKLLQLFSIYILSNIQSVPFHADSGFFTPFGERKIS